MLSPEEESISPMPGSSEDQPPSTDGAAISATTSDQTSNSGLPSSTGLIKCPMYCRSNCIIQHHPLLVAVLNCVDTEHIELMEMKLGILYNVINKYKQSGRWSANDPVPDVLDEYREPLLHWVCTLGRVGAAVWLVGHDISDPKTRSELRDGETALHRALKCLPETCPGEASRKFVQLLSVMCPALSVSDDYGNTPLHTCCDMMRLGIPRPDYYKQCLHYILYELNREQLTEEYDIPGMLNKRNKEGDTVLHLLAGTAGFLSEIKPLVQLGADYTIENNAGLTPYEVAIKNRCTAIQVFFEKWEGSEPQPLSFLLPGSIKPHDNVTVEVCHAGDPQSTTSSVVLPDEHSESVTMVTEDTHTPEHMQTGPVSMETDSVTMETDNGSARSLNNEGVLLAGDQGILAGDGTSPSQSSPAETVTSQPYTPIPHQDLVQLPDLQTPQAASPQPDIATPTVISDSPATPPLTTSPPAPATPPPFVCFPNDPELQQHLTDAVEKQEKMKGVRPRNGGSRSTDKDWSISYSTFIQNLMPLNSADTELDADEKERIVTMLNDMSPSTISLYLATMRRTGLRYDPAIDFIVSARDDALKELKVNTKCVTELKTVLEKEQEKQDSLVSEIMTSFDHVSKLNQEEETLVSEVSEVSQHAHTAQLSHNKLQQRLDNTEAALLVLKRLYYESMAEDAKT